MTDVVADLMQDAPLPPTLTVSRPPAPVGPGVSIELDKPALHALVDRVLPTVPSRDVLPVLKHLHISAEESVLQIRATSLDRTALTRSALVTVHRPGSALLPAKRLSDILRLAGDGVVTIAVLNGIATISSGRSVWHVRTYPEHGYPPLPDLAATVWCDTDRAALLTAITTVRYAAARGDRIALMALDLAHGRLTACDGARFHQMGVDSDLPALRLPVNALDDVVRLLSRHDTAVLELGLTDRHIVLRLGPDTLMIHRLSGQYPDMQQQLLRPALENRHTLTVNRVDLVAAIRQVRVNAHPETCAVRLHLSADQLTVTAQDQHGNSAEAVLDAQWDRAPRQFSVHHGHLLELLATQSDQDCVFWLGADTATRRSPLLLRSADGAAPPSLAVVQQMRESGPA